MRHLISLGSRCDVAFQLRMHSGENVAHFFDWLVVPPESLPKIFNRKFDVFAPEHLERGAGAGTNPEITDVITGVSFFHQFPLYAGKFLPEFLIDYPSFIAKFRHLAKRFEYYARSHPVTFVRRTVSPQEAEQIENAFFELFPGADAQFLYINNHEKHFVSKHGHSRYLPNTRDTMGDPVAWSRMLLDEGLVKTPYRLSTLDILGPGHDIHNMSVNNRFSIDQLQAAISANPKKADYHYELARNYRGSGRLEAEAAIDMAISLNPDNKLFQLERVLVLKMLGKLQGPAYLTALSSCSTPEDESGASLLLADACLDARQFEEAIPHFDTYLRSQPTDAIVLHRKAIALRNCKRGDQAERAINLSIALMPNRAKAHLLKSLILSTAGRRDEAVASARDAVKLDAGPDFKYHLAFMLEKMGSNDEAVSIYQSLSDQHAHTAAIDRIKALQASS